MPAEFARQLAICQEGLKFIWKQIKSHIFFAHFVNNETCKALGTDNCLETIDSASTPFRLKLKEAHNLEETIH